MSKDHRTEIRNAVQPLLDSKWQAFAVVCITENGNFALVSNAGTEGEYTTELSKQVGRLKKLVNGTLND